MKKYEHGRKCNNKPKINYHVTVTISATNLITILSIQLYQNSMKCVGPELKCFQIQRLWDLPIDSGLDGWHPPKLPHSAVVFSIENRQ